MGTIIINVDYDEFKPETYRGVYVSRLNNELFRSNTGRFKKDYRECYFFAKKTGGLIMNASSVDHWQLDSKAER